MFLIGSYSRQIATEQRNAVQNANIRTLEIPKAMWIVTYLIRRPVKSASMTKSIHQAILSDVRNDALIAKRMG